MMAANIVLMYHAREIALFLVKMVFFVLTVFSSKNFESLIIFQSIKTPSRHLPAQS